MKKLICAFLMTLSLSITTPTYSAGLPTIDIANLTQSLIDYLNQIENLQYQLNQTQNQIEQLRRLEVPSLSNLRDLNYLIQEYKNLANQYNTVVGGYNNLNEKYEKLKSIDESLKLCSEGELCSESQMRQRNAAKIKLLQDMQNQLKEDATYYTSFNNPQSYQAQAIDPDFKAITAFSTKTEGLTEGEIQARQLEIQALLAAQIVKLRYEFADARGKDSDVKYREKVIQDADVIQDISNYATQSSEGQ